MHPPLDGRPLSQLPVNDIRNAEMLSEFMNIHTISKRVSEHLPILHTVPKLTLLY